MTIEQILKLTMGTGNNVKVARHTLTALAEQLDKGEVKGVTDGLRALATRGAKVEGEKKGKKKGEAKSETPAPEATSTTASVKPDVKVEPKAKPEPKSAPAPKVTTASVPAAA